MLLMCCVVACLYLLGTFRVNVLETVHAHYMYIPAAQSGDGYLCELCEQKQLLLSLRITVVTLLVEREKEFAELFIQIDDTLFLYHNYCKKLQKRSILYCFYH